MGPIFDQLSKDDKHKNVTFIKINVDQNEMSDVCQELGVSSIPLFVFFKDGAKVDSLTGANETKLKELLSTHFK